jgi:hypothetical protein
MKLGYDQPLYIQPFDHRGSFQTKMFGWKGDLTPEQTAEIAATKQIIYDGFKAAVAGGVPREKAGILVDEQCGAAIHRFCSRPDGVLGTADRLAKQKNLARRRCGRGCQAIPGVCRHF